MISLGGLRAYWVDGIDTAKAPHRDTTSWFDTNFELGGSKAKLQLLRHNDTR